MIRTHDKKKTRQQAKTSRAERQYASALRKVAEQVGHMIGAFPPGDPAHVPTITDMLRRYAEALNGWAIATAGNMLAEVNRQDRDAWRAISQEMSRELRDQIQNTPTGELMRTLLAEQVTLIKSIPLDAAKRVHELTLKGLEDSTRADAIAAEIKRSGEVSASRAMLIARTETARTAATLKQARAESVGSIGYIWRTSGDSDVRQSHKEMNGKFFRWDTPPTLSDGTATHPGCIYNCRCFASPVLPED